MRNRSIHFEEKMIFLLLLVISVGLFNSEEAVSTNDEGSIDIAAFNVRVFGVTKMQDNDVIKHLTNIILRYDLIIIQEIRDNTGESIRKLFDGVRKATMSRSNNSSSYKMELSPRLGRSVSKEEYAFIYRDDILNLTSFYTFPDSHDVFEREPFIAKFHCEVAAINEFAVAAIHISPRDAENEISNLTTVYEHIVKTYGIDDVIIAGDFNAGCSYVRNWTKIQLATDKRFYWLIDNSKDTTTEYSDCTYDRIVIAGNKLIEATLPGSGNVYLFDEDFGIDTKEALKVSDHYPVEMKLRLENELTNNVFGESIDIKDRRLDQFLLNSASKVYKLRTQSLQKQKYEVLDMFTKTGAYLEIVFQRKATIHTAKQYLEEFEQDFPQFIYRTQMCIGLRFIDKMIERPYLAHGRGLYKTLQDYYDPRSTEITLQLKCNLAERNRPQCWLNIRSFIT